MQRHSSGLKPVGMTVRIVTPSQRSPPDHRLHALDTSHMTGHGHDDVFECKSRFTSAKDNGAWQLQQIHLARLKKQGDFLERKKHDTHEIA